ncbi:MAG: tetratricopeptide repeat protein [Chitinophagaceae bacterium]|nr:tetratricopeptide repeat protein [Chitinophagaceae bacterium]
MKGRLVFCCALMVLSLVSTAQNKYVDSLEKYLREHPKYDTTYVMTTHRLSYRLSEIDIARAWRYANETKAIAKQIGFERGQCLANVNFAILESNEGNYKNSAEYYLAAIEIAERLNYTRGLSISYNNIADNYLDLKDYKSAVDYSKKAYELNKQIGEIRGQAINLEQLGNIYYQQHDFETAKKYWDMSYPLAEKSKDGNIYSQVLIDLAKYDLEKGNYTASLNHLKTADSIATSSSEILSSILTYKGYASVYHKLGNPQKSFEFLHRALDASRILKNKTEECDIFNLMSQEFETIGQFDSGMYYLRKHKLLSDTVLGEKNFAHLAFLRTKHESELKERENKKLKSIQEVQTKRISDQNILLIVASIAIALGMLSFILYFRSFQNKKKHAELEEQHRISQYNQQIAELEVKSLRAQMNPHFLFNSLNSIRNYIIKNEPQVASNYLANFATLMRKILDASQQSKIALEEEVSMLTLYLNLELMRFSNGFTYTIDVEDELKDENIDIPSMVLQPFIENAIWHGLLNKEDGTCMLRIVFKENPDDLQEIIAEIEDNGIGREASAAMQNAVKKHKSKGILITKERLHRISNMKRAEPIEIIDLKKTDGTAKGTLVRIYLPVM